MPRAPELSNQQFFRKVWPVIAAAVTSFRAGSAAELLPLMRRLRLPRGARILDVPCGYGRHSIELARHGYRVTGVDFAPELLAMAREQAAARSLDVEFRRDDMRRLAYQKRFDAVLNLFTSFGYFGEAGDLRVLRRFRRALRPGGWLVLHMAHRDWVMRNYRPHHRSRIAHGFTLEERVRFDFSTSVAHGTWIASRRGKRWRGTTHLRLYSCHELVRMLEAAGFRNVQAFGGFRGQPLSVQRRWQVLLAQR